MTVEIWSTTKFFFSPVFLSFTLAFSSLPLSVSFLSPQSLSCSVVLQMVINVKVLLKETELLLSGKMSMVIRFSPVKSFGIAIVQQWHQPYTVSVYVCAAVGSSSAGTVERSSQFCCSASPSAGWCFLVVSHHRTIRSWGEQAILHAVLQYSRYCLLTCLSVCRVLWQISQSEVGLQNSVLYQSSRKTKTTKIKRRVRLCLCQVRNSVPLSLSCFALFWDILLSHVDTSMILIIYYYKYLLIIFNPCSDIVDVSFLSAPVPFLWVSSPLGDRGGWGVAGVSVSYWI